MNNNFLSDAGTIRASDLLARQTTKFTLVLPTNLHTMLKSIAAQQRLTVKELMIEALREYTIPKYTGKKVIEQ